ncbi:MAG: YgeY family selenium metabolism-linked hydrolase [Spirochaetaceae bacterium]|jgi:putative selenium metabolism hydrolase|nr:YgeY family selenium metabolism-linked hydrolase [Spirochaetaceae bacterium]
MFKEIQEKAKEYRQYTAEVLSEIVKIPSYSGKEEAVCKKIVELCKEAGFDEVRIDKLGSVIARIGSGKKILALDAHIDTVGTGDLSQWNRPTHSGDIDETYVYGRGTTDQKGGAASMIAAGRILKELNFSEDFTLYFTFTVMEEDCDGMCWKYLIEEEKLIPDFAVSTEPTSCRLYRGHRGRMEMEVSIKGVSSHGSAPERGVNAAYKASRAALAMEKLNLDLQPDQGNFLGKGSIVVSQMEVHGPSQCAVPDVARLYLDRRLTWGEDANLAISQVKQYIKEALGEEPESVTMPEYKELGYRNYPYFQELYFPTWKIEEDHPLVQGGAAAYEQLFQKKPVIDKWTFSTNGVAICGRHKIPTIGFGPGDEKEAHAPNEKNRIDDLEICSAFYAALPYALKEKL